MSPDLGRADRGIAVLVPFEPRKPVWSPHDPPPTTTLSNVTRIDRDNAILLLSLSAHRVSSTRTDLTAAWPPPAIATTERRARRVRRRDPGGGSCLVLPSYPNRSGHGTALATSPKVGAIDRDDAVLVLSVHPNRSGRRRYPQPVIATSPKVRRVERAIPVLVLFVWAHRACATRIEVDCAKAVALVRAVVAQMALSRGRRMTSQPGMATSLKIGRAGCGSAVLAVLCLSSHPNRSGSGSVSPPSRPNRAGRRRTHQPDILTSPIVRCTEVVPKLSVIGMSPDVRCIGPTLPTYLRSVAQGSCSARAPGSWCWKALSTRRPVVPGCMPGSPGVSAHQPRPSPTPTLGLGIGMRGPTPTLELELAEPEAFGGRV
jgi:hypothetical protein